jgi:5-oxoprolinase (ATP-hydrolysing) subunit A
MGESTRLWQYSLENDISLLQYINSMNLACGFHAGDPHTMHELVDAALHAGVSVGAHPGFDDKENFGRTDMQLSPEKVYEIVLYQIGALEAFLRVMGTSLHHVKPHGALYNMAAKDAVMAAAICKAVFDFDDTLILYGLSGSKLIAEAETIGLPTRSEVFADRTYQDDGSLTPRSMPNALIESADQSVAQLLQMVKQGTVNSVNGKNIPIKAETVCIHSDGKHALEFARSVHDALAK